jgi:beta-glucosidase/6-phospho-beta-glucosidase/beta-galactosidase
MLREVYERYGRPLFIAETGIEDDLRPSWLRYVCEEVQEALRAGVPVEGICLYPILNHPGWEDDRHCHNGLWDYATEAGDREIHEPLAQELRHQQKLFEHRLMAVK